jgi:hypothetical protein
MAQFWIAIFFIFLAVAQLYQSIKDINLPLPVYLVLGAMLAIASNSQQQLSFTSARQTTRLEIEKSNPILSLIPVALPDDLQSLDTTIHPCLSAETLPSQVELANELKPLNSDPASLLLSEQLHPLTEVRQEDIQLVNPDVLPILSTESLSPPAEINPEELLPAVRHDAAPVTLAAALLSQQEVRLVDSKSVSNDLNVVGSEVLQVPQNEAIAKEGVKPVTRKTSRKKLPSAKKTSK